jgi:hypothetical protein
MTRVLKNERGTKLSKMCTLIIAGSSCETNPRKQKGRQARRLRYLSIMTRWPAAMSLICCSRLSTWAGTGAVVLLNKSCEGL